MTSRADLSYRDRLMTELINFAAKYPAGAGEGTRRMIDEGRSPGRASMRKATKSDAARLKAMKVPPAWKNVEIADDPDAALQVVGIDSKGRTQYRYSAEHSERAAAEKFERVREFTAALPKIRAAIRADLGAEGRVGEAAAVLYLIDKTGFRVGSDDDTGADVEAIGATTLRAEHVTVRGDRTSFRFVGKKGVLIEKVVVDVKLAALISERRSGGGPLFSASDEAVREYLKDKAGDFKVKDFRTYHGTATALRVIRQTKVPATPREFKQSQAAVAKAVAASLGNTPAVALKSYIDPAVWSKWRKN